MQGYHEKNAKVVKFTKIHQTFKILTKDGQRRTVLKLVGPRNLLKQENVSHSAHVGLAAGARSKNQII